MADDASTPTQQIAGGPHPLGIDLSQREITTAHEPGDLEGINTVVLGFAPINGLHIKRVAQDKVDAVFFTQFRDPIPAVHAFDTHGEIITEGFQQSQ